MITNSNILIVVTFSGQILQLHGASTAPTDLVPHLLEEGRIKSGLVCVKEILFRPVLVLNRVEDLTKIRRNTHWLLEPNSGKHFQKMRVLIFVSFNDYLRRA